MRDLGSDAARSPELLHLRWPRALTLHPHNNEMIHVGSIGSRALCLFLLQMLSLSWNTPLCLCLPVVFHLPLNFNLVTLLPGYLRETPKTGKQTGAEGTLW